MNPVAPSLVGVRKMFDRGEVGRKNERFLYYRRVDNIGSWCLHKDLDSHSGEVGRIIESVFR